MENKENIIDFQEWTVPTSWEQVTLKQFEDIERLHEEKEGNVDIRDYIHILCNKTKDDVNALPLEFLENIMEKLSFIQEPIKEIEPSSKLKIDGIEYSVHTEQQLKTGEYVAASTVLKEDKHNYAAILAILCRKEDETYDSTFENEVVEDRIKMWEKQPITSVMSIINFFLSCYIASEIPIQLSLEVEEAIDLTRKRIETSKKNGDLSALSTILLKRKLRKLEKSIKFI